ncbi:YcxB family protein [Dyella sp. Tek66A03]|uniref:YcxB family protein n=1 Tax=Dyella sp. Tek66A03 TaxID=3458298 RepID=UPI00403ED8EA
MELRGRIAVEDLMAAQWVHVRPRRSLAVIGILLLGLVVFAMATSFLVRRQSLTDPTTWILPGILAYLAFTAFVWVPRKVRRSYSQRKDFQHEISMMVTSAGVAARTEQGNSVKPWSDYLKWKEGKSVFLLYLSDQLFQIVPKRFFATHEDIDAFRNIIRQSIGAK